MNILLNLYPVRSGGGQQVATNFVKVIAKNNFGHRWYIFVGDGSELHKISKKLIPNSCILSIVYNYKNRLLKSGVIKDFIATNKIDIVYSFGPIFKFIEVPQVLRSVYSNLYFPEIYFWEGYSKFLYAKKKIIDFFRLKQTLKADGLIFENKSMLERAINLFKYPENKVIYIAPSVTDFDEKQLSEKYKELESFEEFKILYLSSWHLNKNIHILPEVAKILSSNNFKKVKFILTIDVNNSSVQKFLLNKIKKFKVENYFHFIGKVEAVYVHQVVKSSDAMILLSKLECFSSNVIEAYTFKKPLIIADEEWSRSSCDNAALFVDRNNPINIAESILKLINSKELKMYLVKLSEVQLRQFNKPEEKVKKQVEFLEKIHSDYEKNN